MQKTPDTLNHLTRLPCFIFTTELFVRLNVLFCFVFCYYLQLVQEKEERNPLPLKAETLTCT